MSKKSRKRNKRLLMLAALAGGAALMGRRGKGTGAVSTAGQPVGVDRTMPPSQYITKKDVLPETETEPTVTKGVKFNQPVRGRLTVDGMGPNELRMHRAKTAGNLVPPSMRGGALHAEGFQQPGRNITGRRGKTINRPSYNMYGLKKGGRVTGIAKRGFGRALMKGKK